MVVPISYLYNALGPHEPNVIHFIDKRQKRYAGKTEQITRN